MGFAAYSETDTDVPDIAGPARAAILLLAMGSNGASRLLKHFSHDEIRALRESVSAQKPVSAHQVEQLVEEFQEEFKTGPGLSGLDQEMTKLLRSALSADEMTKVFGDDDFIDPSLFMAPQLSVWEELERLGISALQLLLIAEHPQVVAIVIARLQAEVAAAVVAGFEPSFRNDVMRRMLSARPLNAAAEQAIEDNLREIFIAGDDGAEKTARRQSLAEIANRMEKVQTDEFLASIEDNQPDEATAIRSLLFAFEDLPNVPKKGRLILFDDVPTEVVTLALRNAPPELVETVTSSLSARARRMVEAELGRPADVSAKDVTAARRSIAALALRLASEGRIVLTEPKEG
ncbi:MAG: flagellar motor switch protein FliG [Rhizobiaceae bacterium]|nr:flagellar motor switch protein FliG [Rhizobiaceae bacterium]